MGKVRRKDCYFRQMPHGNQLPEGGSVGLLAGLGSLDDPILPHTGNNAGDFLFGERRHRHANTMKPARRGPVDQGSLIILQEVCNLGGACLAREAHHRKSAVLVLGALPFDLHRSLRPGENVHDRDSLQRDCEHGKGCRHRHGAWRQVCEESGDPSGDGTGRALVPGIGLGIDRRHQLVGNPRRRRAERFVEMNGFGKLLAHKIDVRQFGIVAQRLFDTLPGTAS